jgi:hypothetical protein
MISVWSLSEQADWCILSGGTYLHLSLLTMHTQDGTMHDFAHLQESNSSTASGAGGIVIQLTTKHSLPSFNSNFQPPHYFSPLTTHIQDGAMHDFAHLQESNSRTASGAGRIVIQ